jgi:predicted DNA-binding transcriptional regulator AlpA
MTYQRNETPEPMMAASETDRVIYRQDLCTLLGVGSEAMRRWLKAGKLPKPDVDISQKTRGWKVSTLRAAGIDLV